MTIKAKTIGKIFVLLGNLLVLFPSLSTADEQELLFGTYLFTLRNLDTRGATLAYRYWLSRSEVERERHGFSVFYPYPVVVGLEARGGRLVDPETGFEGGLLLNFRLELSLIEDLSAGIVLGAGGSYSEMDYENVPTHYNFISRGGIFCRFQRFLVQAAYEHRSNGHLRSSNRGLDVITGSAGFRF